MIYVVKCILAARVHGCAKTTALARENSPATQASERYCNCLGETRQPFSNFLTLSTGCDNSDRDKQLKQVFKNAQSVKKS